MGVVVSSVLDAMEGGAVDVVVSPALDAMEASPFQLPNHLVLNVVANMVVLHLDMVVVDQIVDYSAGIVVDHSVEVDYSAGIEVDHSADMEEYHSADMEVAYRLVD